MTRDQGPCTADTLGQAWLRPGLQRGEGGNFGRWVCCRFFPLLARMQDDLAPVAAVMQNLAAL